MPIFKLHLPILDEVKEKGLKTTLQERSVDVVTRVTSGPPDP
jgi:hypothetical protein